MSAQIDRRAFLGASAAGAALLAAGLPMPAHAQVRTPSRGSAKNLIFMVADGMSIGTFQLANRWHELSKNQQSPWANLIEREGAKTTLVQTRSANSEVTDSAAASSAWSIGEIVDSGAISITPQGRAIEPILLRAKRTGRATALVSTARITHATPAAWAANIDRRNKEDEIAEQLIDRDIDILLGGGARHFPQPLLDRAAGAQLVTDRESMMRTTASTTQRLIGLFADEHMAYEVDRRHTDQPSLTEMTRTALGRLDIMDKATTNGFVMQIEAARVDHAAHACDAAGIFHDQLMFEETIVAVLDWMEGRDDTLLVITTDHGNASPSVTLYGDQTLDTLANAGASFERMGAQIEQAGGHSSMSPDQLRDVVSTGTGITLKDNELNMLVRSYKGERINAFRALSKPWHVLGTLLANHNKVSFVSGNHTAEPVLQTAFGPGSESMPMIGHLKDTHSVIARALDLPKAELL